MNNDTPDSNANIYAGDEIVPGTPVYDIDGREVGDVDGYDAQGGYFNVKMGLIFKREVYIPLSAIGQRTADGIHLTLPKNQLSNQGWDTPPDRTQASGLFESERETRVGPDAVTDAPEGVFPDDEIRQRVRQSEEADEAIGGVEGAPDGGLDDMEWYQPL